MVVECGKAMDGWTKIEQVSTSYTNIIGSNIHMRPQAICTEFNSHKLIKLLNKQKDHPPLRPGQPDARVSMNNSKQVPFFQITDANKSLDIKRYSAGKLGPENSERGNMRWKRRKRKKETLLLAERLWTSNS